ncbi:MAG: hypothetical protein V1773_06945 [bacterium]
MKKVLIIVLLFLIGCAAHFERKNTPMPEYLAEINEKCEGKNIIVVFYTDETEKGLFIKIDQNILAVEKDGKLVEFAVADISKIKYPRGFSPSGMAAGAALGFLASVIPITAIKPKMVSNDLLNYVAIIPITMAVGGVVCALTIDNYNTISLGE